MSSVYLCAMSWCILCILYSDDQLVNLQLIALLAKHHRKKLPNVDHVSFKELPEEVSSYLNI